MSLATLGSHARADQRAHTAFLAARPRHDPNTGGSAIVAALETAWGDVRTHHRELPAVVIITGSGWSSHGLTWGHFARDRWHDAITHGRRPEIFVGGERLATGADLTLQTLLHEACHAIAYARGVDDTSSGHRYHNAKFLSLANEVGLSYPDDRPHHSLGYSAVVLTSDARKRYVSTINALRRAITVHLDDPSKLIAGLPTGLGGHGGRVVGGRGRKGTGGASRIKLTCNCGRSLYASAKTYDEGEIICGICDGEFKA